MKRFRATILIFSLLLLSTTAFALSSSGIVPDTTIEYSGLEVRKEGVNVVLVNSSDVTVRISVKLLFFNAENDRIAETFFALREIAPRGSSGVQNNFLNGNWKKTAKAPRLRWELFTYDEQR